MRKLFVYLVLAVSAVTAFARDRISRNISDLPIAAQTVIKNNFKSNVSIINIDKDFGHVSEFEVILTDGTEIVFDRSGNWKEIDVSNSKSVPNSMVPSAIQSFVKNNQKKARIVGIEKERNGYTVDLSNGVEIKFDKNGKFIKYD